MSNDIITYEQNKEILERQEQIEEKLDLIFGILTGQIKPEDIKKEIQKEETPTEDTTQVPEEEVQLPQY